MKSARLAAQHNPVFPLWLAGCTLGHLFIKLKFVETYRRVDRPSQSLAFLLMRTITWVPNSEDIMQQGVILWSDANEGDILGSRI